MTLLDETLQTPIMRPATAFPKSGLRPLRFNFYPITTMTPRLTTGFIALGCVLMASCYPYNENQQKPGKKPAPDQTVTSAEQQKIKEDRDKLKKKEELAKKDEIKPTAEPSTNPTTGEASTTPKPAQEKRDYSVANKVPGKEGFVFSPYNNKVVDVRDIPSGTLVQDPTYPAADKKYFRVP